MLLHRLILIMFLLGTSVSCGFTPVYGKKSDNVLEKLSEINLSNVTGDDAHLLKNELQNFLNPKGQNNKAKYNLTVHVSRTMEAQDIQINTAVTRWRIKMKAQYKLTDVTKNKVIVSNWVLREGEFDKVTSEFATYVSEKEANKNIINELAQEIRLRISSYIKSNKI